MTETSPLIAGLRSYGITIELKGIFERLYFPFNAELSALAGHFGKNALSMT